MYPKIRVEKRHPDLSPRAAWEAYRLPDQDGAVRLWTPSRTPRVHVNGRWAPAESFVTVWKPGERFVVAVYEDADGMSMYIDIVRACVVEPSRFAYVDLYVDVLHKNGVTSTKDEHLLSNLAAEEAASVLTTRDEIVRAVQAGDPPFRFGDPRWRVPDEARRLTPGVELAL